MTPDEVEQMLFEHAIRSKARPPLAERISNLGFNQILTGGIMAGVALLCSLLMPSSVTHTAGNTVLGNNSSPSQISNTDSNKHPSLAPNGVYPHTADSVNASLAMSPIGG